MKQPMLLESQLLLLIFLLLVLLWLPLSLLSVDGWQHALPEQSSHGTLLLVEKQACQPACI